MENQRIFLLLFITISNIQTISSVPHPIRFTQFLLHQRSMSNHPNGPLFNWHLKECYEQLKRNSTAYQTAQHIKEQSDYTKQFLLEAASQDPTLEPTAITTLLSAGADINTPNAAGQTPVHHLAKASQEFNDASLKKVLAYINPYSPNFEAVDRHGKTPKDYATQKVKKYFT